MQGLTKLLKRLFKHNDKKAPISNKFLRRYKRINKKEFVLNIEDIKKEG
ncbi:MAG: hypothetical protein AB7S44_00730 [Spirochaetales bacterium]